MTSFEEGVLFWQVVNEHCICFTQCSFTFNQRILTSVFLLQDASSWVTSTMVPLLVSWAEVALSYSGVPFRFDAAEWSFGEEHIPLTEEQGKRHTLQKDCGWIHSNRFRCTVQVNLSESWSDRNARGCGVCFTSELFKMQSPTHSVVPRGSICWESFTNSSTNISNGFVHIEKTPVLYNGCANHLKKKQPAVIVVNKFDGLLV